MNIKITELVNIYEVHPSGEHHSRSCWRRRRCIPPRRHISETFDADNHTRLPPLWRLRSAKKITFHTWAGFERFAIATSGNLYNEMFSAALIASLPPLQLFIALGRFQGAPRLRVRRKINHRPPPRPTGQTSRVFHVVTSWLGRRRP